MINVSCPDVRCAQCILYACRIYSVTDAALLSSLLQAQKALGASATSGLPRRGITRSAVPASAAAATKLV